MKKDGRLSMIVFITCLVAGLLCTFVVFFSEHRSDHRTLELVLENQVGQMQDSIDQTMNQIHGLQALVIGTNGENVDMDAAGPYLVRDDYIKNVFLAPNGVVTQVYPFNGNEYLIGDNLYQDDSFVGKNMSEKIAVGEIVISGPFMTERDELVVTGSAKVYIPDMDGSVRDWGVVSITLDFPQMAENSLAQPLESAGYVCRLSFEDDAGEYEEFLESNGFSDGADCETCYFTVNGRNFMIEVYPSGGWFNEGRIALTCACVIAASVLIGFAVQKIVQKSMQLRNKATIDALTGLFNRSSGIDKVNKVLRGEEKKKAAFLLIDIDHFKSVNDILDHQTGDRVLAETAQLLRSVCRPEDIVCRLGGDEFVMFLPCGESCDFVPQKAGQVNSILRRVISKDGKSVATSCSIGIALAGEDGSNFTALYHNADAALYLSKNKGRDCASFYSETVGPVNES